MVHAPTTAAATAAVATAAHDVLWHYFPGARDRPRCATWRRRWRASRTGSRGPRGCRIGGRPRPTRSSSPGCGRRLRRHRPSTTRAARRRHLAARAPAPDMLGAWLGSIGLRSSRCAGWPSRARRPGPADERRLRHRLHRGEAASAPRRPPCAARRRPTIAQFFSANAATRSATASRSATARGEPDEPGAHRLDVRGHGRGRLTDFIQSWQLKCDVGFWRPYQAIAGAGHDGNPDTSRQTGGRRSGHQPAVLRLRQRSRLRHLSAGRGVRQTFGDDIRPGPADRRRPVTRPTPRLSALEHDTLNARIWGGLHFRDAMDDGVLTIGAQRRHATVMAGDGCDVRRPGGPPVRMTPEGGPPRLVAP